MTDHTPSTEEREELTVLIANSLAAAYRSEEVHLTVIMDAIDKYCAATAKASEEAILEKQIEELTNFAKKFEGLTFSEELHPEFVKGLEAAQSGVFDICQQRIADLRKTLNLDQESK